MRALPLYILRVIEMIIKSIGMERSKYQDRATCHILIDIEGRELALAHTNEDMQRSIGANVIKEILNSASNPDRSVE